MNYVSVVYAVVVVIIAIDWFARGKKSYRGQSTRQADAEIIADHIAVDHRASITAADHAHLSHEIKQ